MSTKHGNLSWPDRFALIEHYAPSSDDVICSSFNVSADELASARQLKTAGTLVASSSFDAARYGNPFDASATATVHARPESATKRTKVPQKRGRKGNKIATALLAIPTTPVDVETFQKSHSVSLAVLRQSKRFLAKLPADEAAKIGKINVRKDKTTKALMIWREIDQTTV